MLTSAGKDLAIYDGFTYFCHHRNKATDYWACTKSGSRIYCKAGITMSKNREFIKRNENNHNHSPPQFVIRKGVLIKI